ncbi:MAG: hypothetical protein ABI352_00015 [Candidatus Dormibacter sp.]
MAKQTAAKTAADDEQRDHMARVWCTDDVWAEFTQGVHLDGGSVSAALGDLVRADVGRRRRAAGATEAASARRAVLALEDAKELAASLTALTARLESLAKWEHKEPVAADPIDPMDSLNQRWTTPALAKLSGTATTTAAAAPPPLPDDWMIRPRPAADGGRAGPADIPEWEE